MTDAKPSLVPVEQTFRITEEMIDENAPPDRVKKYQSMVGCLTFVQVWTRPDIGFQVNQLSRYLTRPSESLVKSAKKVVRYMKHSRKLGLRFARYKPEFNGEGFSMVVAYTDASDADCLITRRSTGGHVLLVGPCPTMWKVGRQPIVTLSTAESELIQIGMCVQDVQYLRDVLQGLGFPQVTTVIKEDNQATIQIAENPCHRDRTKHLGRRYMFIREAIDRKDVAIVYCDTDNNIADIFTKPLAHDRFIHLRNILLGYEGYNPE